jgi:HEAT repeat protein
MGMFAAGAVSHLMEATHDPERRVRSLAIETLGKLGPGAIPAVPALIAAVNDNDPKIRTKAVAALGSLGPLAKSALPILLPLLDHPSGPFMLQVGAAVWKIARKKVVISTLIKALDDRDWETCFGAAFALACIGPAAKSALPALELLAKHEDERLRAVAASAIRDIRGVKR